MRAAADLETTADAEAAFDVALTALVQRLTPGEAEDLLSQLPSLLRARLPLPSGPRKEITRQTMEDELAKRLDVTPDRAARILEAFGATLARNVSEGQMDDVRLQLPEKMRTIFPA